MCRKDSHRDTHRSEPVFAHAVGGGIVNAVTQSIPLTSQLDTILAHCLNVCACLFVLSGIFVNSNSGVLF